MGSASQGARVLLVDDDPIVLRLYRDGLTRNGFSVTTAADGLAALKALQAFTPDVVILDLMMPRFSGTEVLQFIRSHQQTAALPVIVLSNAYMDPMAHNAARLGAQKGLLKIKCNLTALVEALDEVFGGGPATLGDDQLLAAPATAPAKPPPVAPRIPLPPPKPPTAASRQADMPKDTLAAESYLQARQELAANSAAIDRSLREDCEALGTAPDQLKRKDRLESLHRKLHFLTSLAGLAEHAPLSKISGAFEALLFAMMDNPRLPDPALSQTLSQAAALVHALLTQPPPNLRSGQDSPRVLVVEADVAYGRRLLSALRNANVQGQCVATSAAALDSLKQRPHAAVVLNTNTPGVSPRHFCEMVRSLKGYAATPLIAVHSDKTDAPADGLATVVNESAARALLPAQLAVRIVMHLLRNSGSQPHP